MQGITGESVAPSSSIMYSTSTYPISVLMIEIVTLPRKQIKAPTPFVITNEAAFLRARAKAAIAEEQKLSPVSAT